MEIYEQMHTNATLHKILHEEFKDDWLHQGIDTTNL
jgi:hypothetical protein